MFPFAIPVVRLIVPDHDHKVLLLMRSRGSHAAWWCLPGGKLDYGKTVEETIRAELKDETNLDLESFRFLFMQDSLPMLGEKHYLNLYFECHWNGYVELNEESSAHCWISREEISLYKIAFHNEQALIRLWAES